MTEEIDKSGYLVSIEVKVNGKTIPDTAQVYSIEIEQTVNRISHASIVILDGDVTTGKFNQSSSDHFVPGNKMTIEAGYDTQNTQIFEGVITKQSIKIDAHLGSSLIVECRDEAFKMTVGRKSKTFNKQKDSDIISTIAGNYSGLETSIEATKTEWPEQVQYYTSDWDFILSRAQANGFIVTTIDGKLTVGKYDAETKPVFEAEYGVNVFGFDAQLDAASQVNKVVASSWDFKTQEMINGEATLSAKGPGNISAEDLAKVVGLSQFDLQTPANLNKADLTNWSKAQLVKNEYAKIKGHVKIQGTDEVSPGKFITLSRLGDRFNGNHFVSSVQHRIEDGNWFTTICIGLSPFWFTEQTDVMAPPAAGLLPGVRGVYNATVKKMYEDPDNQYRVLIDMPIFDPSGQGLWARLSNFYSTSGAGAFFLPEVGDEVVVAFLNEDPRYPIILGSLYSSTKNKPFNSLQPNQDNSKKAIVSKSQIVIEFDDKDKVLTINTPSKNTIVLSDKDKQISITDQNSNSVVMSSSGITMTSPKDITIKSDQKVNINGAMGVAISSSGGDINTNGVNVKTNANAQYSAQGGATASVQGGAQLTLKAAMVMIN